MKSLLYKHTHPCDFVLESEKDFFDRALTPKLVHTVSEKEFMIVLPYFCNLSSQTRIEINLIIKNKLTQYNLWIIFQTKCKLIIFSTFQDEILVFLRAGIVFEFKCCDCITTEHGKTKRHFKVNICEHFRVYSLPGKKIKRDNGSALIECDLFCSHSFGFDNLPILVSNNNVFYTLMESLPFNSGHPTLSKNRQSLTLELFDN